MVKSRKLLALVIALAMVLSVIPMMAIADYIYDAEATSDIVAFSTWADLAQGNPDTGFPVALQGTINPDTGLRIGFNGLEPGEYEMLCEDTGWRFTANGVLRNINAADIGNGLVTADLVNVVIPTMLQGTPITAIADGVLAGRLEVTSVEIGAHITRLGEGAFTINENLAGLTFTAGVPAGYVMDNGRLYKQDSTFGLTLLYVPISFAGTYSSADVTRIGNNVFFNTNLTSVDFPEVTSLGNSALRETLLTTIDLPNVDAIGSSVFHGTPITSAALYSATVVGSGAFRYTSLTSIDLPNVTRIENDTFRGTEHLTSVYLPNVIFVGNNVFRYNQSLELISLPNATFVGHSAFRSMPSLVSVYMPNVEYISAQVFLHSPSVRSVSAYSATTIGSQAFENTAITSIDLLDIVSIGSRAFFNVPLRSISVGGNLNSIETTNVFQNVPRTAIVYVEENSWAHRWFLGDEAPLLHTNPANANGRWLPENIVFWGQTNTVTLPDGGEVEIPGNSWIEDNGDGTVTVNLVPPHGPATVTVSDDGSDYEIYVGNGNVNVRDENGELLVSFPVGGDGEDNGDDTWTVNLPYPAGEIEVPVGTIVGEPRDSQPGEPNYPGVVIPVWPYPSDPGQDDPILVTPGETLPVFDGRVMFHFTQVAAGGLFAPLNVTGVSVDTLTRGGTYTMEVWLQDVGPFAGMYIPMQFDTDVITIENIEWGARTNNANYSAGHMAFDFAGRAYQIGTMSDVYSINAAGQFLLSVTREDAAPTSVPAVVGDVTLAPANVHHFWTITFTVNEDAANNASPGFAQNTSHDWWTWNPAGAYMTVINPANPFGALLREQLPIDAAFQGPTVEEYIPVIVPDVTFSLTGFARLSGKYEDIRPLVVDAGILVELIDLYDNSVMSTAITQPLTAAATATTTNFELVDLNIADFDVEDYERYMLRFTRIGVGLHAENTREESYLIAEFLIDLTDADIDDEDVIEISNFGSPVWLIAGAFITPSVSERISLADVNLIRALVGTTVEQSTIFDINEINGIDSGDLGRVQWFVGMTRDRGTIVIDGITVTLP
ncbi:MAG: leucine-rich repeat domain-containing protein [Oscillospiraceae bacterium]|nr:leucine-rich repeat domain-containing protein [Oscillospiraceae bacterium]